MAADVIALVLLSAVLHASWNFAVRRAAGDLLVVWLGWLAATLLYTPFALWLIWNRPDVIRLTPEVAGYVIGTGLVHALYTYLLARAYERGELSVVYPIARGTGVGATSLVAFFFLEEPISRLGAVGVTLVVAGVFAMSRPGENRGPRPAGFGSAIAVGATIAIYTLIDNAAVDEIPPLLYIWLLYVFMSAFTWPLVRARREPSMVDYTRQNLVSILLIGPGSLLTYLIILFAFRMEQVSYVVAVREVAVVIGAAIGIVVLGERFTLAKAVAIAGITAGLLCIKAA